ncbi:MAG: prolipoprotein diacylglyceryl transferase [Myxococcota bacterium]|nr:prolipoprotein diacylglyceryl transferase [Myxococcota bacterium]MDW8361322.1 prolipoprotein diacylglyceryl transferase [Myxococcales bacterium]
MDGVLFIPWFKLEAWHVGPIPIQPFGVLVAIAVLVGARVSEHFARRNGIAPRVVADFVAHVVIGGFIAGYFLNAAFYHPERLVKIWNDPTELFKTYLGLSSFGGFIGAIAGAFIWRARRKLPLLPIGDAVCYGFPFGWIFGRMGCFTVHDHPGRVTDFFLAVADYRVGDPPYEPRHDLGLYEMFWAIGAAAVFFALGRKTHRRAGTYWALLPLMYAPVRFLLDFLRATDEEGGDVRYGALTPGQYACIALFVAGLGVLWYVRTRPPVAVPAAAAWPPPAGSEAAAAARAGSSRRASRGRG